MSFLFDTAMEESELPALAEKARQLDPDVLLVLGRTTNHNCISFQLDRDALLQQHQALAAAATDKPVGADNLNPSVVRPFWRNFEQDRENPPKEGLNWMERSLAFGTSTAPVVGKESASFGRGPNEDKDGVEEGPNTDTVSIDKRYRYDSCHFTQEGWDEVADLWLEKLT